MQVLLHEFATGGGFLGLPGSPLPSASLLTEGLAMWRAMAEDLSQVADVQVLSTWDARLPEVKVDGVQLHPVVDCQSASDVFMTLGRRADWVLVVAPESDGHLLQRVTRLEQWGAKLLGPSSEFVVAAGDKSQNADRLAAAGVPTTKGVFIEAGSGLPVGFPYPAVLKPNDGAGSQSLQLISDRKLAAKIGPVEHASRLEEYVPGRACSVGVLCRGAYRQTLPAFDQLLSQDGLFSYQGGRRILDDALNARAARLAYDAVGVLPAALGYVGVDLVLGDCPYGSSDRVIEINPRLTTSYIGLRAIARSNLAAAMLSLAAGESSRVEFDATCIEFDADGTVRSST